MNQKMQIFKIFYTWYEGESDETYLGKNVDKSQFEKDISEAKEFANGLRGKEVAKGNYLGKGYSVECLPQFYEQIIWFLINKKDYVECFMDESEYSIEDDFSKNITVEKMDKEVKISTL